jgi:diguanylate cyclase (GGDEF)-like protein
MPPSQRTIPPGKALVPLDRASRLLDPAPVVLLAGFLGVLLVGYVDYLTGVEVRIFPLYLLPVGLVAYRLGPVAGVAASTLAALTLTLADRLGGKVYAGPAAEYWNIFSEFIGFTVVALLIARQSRQLTRERANAARDGLTGVANRGAFYEVASEELSRARRYGHGVALAYLDLDHFKSINDSLGHRTGDELLVAFADLLRRSTRDFDTVGRLGGDEFAILLPETDAETARQVLGRLHQEAGETFRTRGWEVTVSCGAVAFREAPRSLPELLHRADRVMYDVKRNGRNAVRIAVEGRDG